MTAIMPPPANFLERLALWHDMQAKLKALKQQEILLRKDLFGEAFPTPKEGSTNYVPLAGGYRLQGFYKIERKVDITFLDAMRAELAKMDVKLDPLLNWTASLHVKNYKALSDEARVLFDNILTTQPGTPSMEIVAPKDDEIPQDNSVTLTPTPGMSIHGQEQWTPDFTTLGGQAGAGKTCIAAPEQTDTPSATIVMPPKKTRKPRATKKVDS